METSLIQQIIPPENFFDELFFIIDCPNFTTFSDHFEQTISKTRLPKPNELFKQYDTNTEALIDAIDESDRLMEVWWIVTLFSLGVAALPLTIALLGLTSVYAAYNYNVARKNAIKEKQANIEFFQLLEIKNQAADFLINHLQMPIEYIDTKSSTEIKQEINEYSFPELKPRPLNLKAPSTQGFLLGGFTKGAIVSVSLFSAYYLGVGWLLEAIAYTAMIAAITTPIGLAIGAVISIGVGLYCAKQFYNAKKSVNLIEVEKHNATEKYQQKLEKVHKLSCIQRSMMFFNHLHRSNTNVNASLASRNDLHSPILSDTSNQSSNTSGIAFSPAPSNSLSLSQDNTVSRLII